MTDQVAIHIEGLTKHYGSVHALVDLDLDVRTGEVFGFLGPNGAGKTTTIRTLLDEIRPTAGRPRSMGLDTHEKVGRDPAPHRLRAERPRDVPRPHRARHAHFFANLRGGVDWEHVDQLAERLGADLSRKVGELSSGNRQKVGVIQAFMNRPDVLIMDEPSAGLDPLIQREFQAMMREVAADGRTVFLSSHTLSEVQRVADRVGIIRSGRLEAVESVADLRSKSIRRVEFEFTSMADASVFESLPGVRSVDVEDNRVVLSYDGKMDALLKTATERYDVVDLTSQPADLEEIFLTYYSDEAVTS